MACQRPHFGSVRDDTSAGDIHIVKRHTGKASCVGGWSSLQVPVLFGLINADFSPLISAIRDAEEEPVQVGAEETSASAGGCGNMRGPFIFVW